MAISITDGDDQAWGRFWGQLQPMLERWVSNPQFLGRVSNRDDYCRDIVLLAWEKLQEGDYSKLRSYFDSRRGRANASASASASGSGDSGQASRAFRTWLFRVFKNIGIDYMRQLPEYQGRSRRRRDRRGTGADGTDGRPAEGNTNDYWRAVVTLHSQAQAVNRSFTTEMTAQRMLDFLEESISPRQRKAAELYRRRCGYAAIAEALELRDPADAARVVQRSLDRFKYREALELWMRNYSGTEIAEALELDDAAHAQRIVAAAKELLKRHFRC